MDDRGILSYISAFFYSIILIVCCIFVYSSDETSLLGLILGLILSISTGVSIILGGFYFIFIPLPYISIGKVGTVKLFQPYWRKLLLGALSMACPVLVFVVLFINQ